LFPYTTLFRSRSTARRAIAASRSWRSTISRTEVRRSRSSSPPAALRGRAACTPVRAVATAATRRRIPACEARSGGLRRALSREVVEVSSRVHLCALELQSALGEQLPIPFHRVGPILEVIVSHLAYMARVEFVARGEDQIRSGSQRVRYVGEGGTLSRMIEMKEHTPGESGVVGARLERVGFDAG